MKKWQITQIDPGIAEMLTSRSNISMLCAEVLAARGIRSLEDAAALLNCDGLSDPFLIQDMQFAADVINEAIDAGTSICIYGDYDCDGIMATVILYSCLSELGADVTYYIPEREEGYGMNEEAIRRLHEDGVELIVTVDNGITALREAELIYELGMRLVVTDHHQPLEELPRAEAVVDPHRSDCPSPYKKYCGAGIALLLIAALDGGDHTMALEQFGELAAIATVADVVELSGENRLLVQMGLQLLANTERPGLLALMEKSGVLGKKLTATTLAFSLAPRINAAGRFGSPLQAVNLMLAETPEEAKALAEELEACNQARKKEEEHILEEIRKQIEADPALLRRRVLVFAGEMWHHGVIGIVAARIQERFGKPAFIITLEENGARGSARSFDAFSVFGCLDACRDLLTKYGGHPGAGGFSLEKETLPAFTEAVEKYAADHFRQMPVMTVKADKLLLPQDLTVENIAGLELLEPYGAGNPAPVFALCHAVLKELVPLSGGAHTKLKLIYGTMAIEVLLFRTAPEDVSLKPEDICDLLVTAGLSRFGGRVSLSLIAQDYRRSGVKQARYFAAYETYEQFVRGETLPRNYYAAIAPSREELMAVYKSIPEKGIGIEALFMRMQPLSMNYCKLRIALDVFSELGLVKQELYHETVQRQPVRAKVNLEDSVLLRTVRQKGEV
ncbi:MAG: single-stranded-DNA-specific exonuclease RecJ [Ruminococcus sp.]|nr:single-stranded-DNA-specific exonuclease RecJ [Ruminococcus sp.]